MAVFCLKYIYNYLHCTLLLCLFQIAGVASAQVLQTESFESSISPAPGWKSIKGKSSLTAAFSNQTGALTNPTATAPLGSRVIIFNSASSGVNDTAYLITKPFDFSSCGTNNPYISFQFYHSSGMPTWNDKVAVFINSVPSFTGATPVNHGGGTNVISRYTGLNGWSTYTFNLNASVYNGGPAKYYIILAGISQLGQNIYIDDFKVNTYPSPANAGNVSMNVVQENTAFIGSGFVNQWILGIQCIINSNSGSGVVAANSAVKLDSILMNINGTANTNNIQNAKLWYTGGSPQFSTDYISPFPAGAGYPVATFGAPAIVTGTQISFFNSVSYCFHLEYDTTYFWLTYDISPSAISGDALDAELISAIVSPGNTPCPSPYGNQSSITANTNVYSLPGRAEIGLPYCIPVYTVGWHWTYNPPVNYIQRVQFLNAEQNTTINTYINSVSLQSPQATCYPNCPFTSHPPDYEKWDKIPGQTVIIKQGSSYSFSVQCGPWNNNNFIQCWIDYNHDGDFYDSGERLGPSPIGSLTANAWQTFNFTVPGNGYTGNTLLRVREVYAVSNMDPCAAYTYGETEDFEITIIPDCSPGVVTWLGNSHEWNDASNWCNGVPDQEDSVQINKAEVPGLSSRDYYFPIISGQVTVKTGSLYISTYDTLMIDDPEPADTSLKVYGNLLLEGKLISKNGNPFTASTGNGDVTNNIYTPFRGSVPDARTQILYSAGELSNMGLVSGDHIDAFRFSVYNKNSVLPYSGLSISYGLISGAINSFDNTTPLNTPYLVFGPANYIVASGNNTLHLTSPIIWDGTSSLVIQFCFDNISISGNDLIYITSTLGRNTILLLTSSANSVSGCNLLPGSDVSDNFFSSLASNRPNFNFDISRTYEKNRIALRGDFINNGDFQAGSGRVIMDSVINQSIAGNSITTFHELEISKSLSTQVTLQVPVVVDDTLVLKTGALMLNKRTITINNPYGTNAINATSAFSGPITRNEGFIISEDSLSRVCWNTGNNVVGSGLYRVIPFANSAKDFIPFSFRQIAGDLGIFCVSTYATSPQNLPYPPSVFFLNDTGSVANDNSSSAVDRYWITEKGNGSASADLAFRWAASEKLGIAFNTPNNSPRAYPWRFSSNHIGTWLKTYSSPTNVTQQMVAAPFIQTSNSGFDSVVVRSFNWPQILAGNTPWATPSEAMPNYTPWVVAGSSNAGTLGNGTTQVNLKLFLQGYYTGNQMMIAVLDAVNRPAVCDSIQIDFVEAQSGTSLAKLNTLLYTNGTATVYYPASLAGKNCYIVVRHKNSLETWSKVPVLIRSDGLIYDFTH